MIKIHENEVVTFYMNDYLMTLVSDQDTERIRKHDRKTARVKNGKHKDGKPSYYDVKFPDGFIIKQIEDTHLTPIKARKYKRRF